MKSNREPVLEEFKFHYHFENTVGSSDKYFMAHDLAEARKMFEYACCKRHLNPHLDRIEKWNRWKDTWEQISFSKSEKSLN